MQEAIVLEALWRRQVRDPRSPMYRPGSNGPFFVLINTASGSQKQQHESILRQHFRQIGIAAHFIPVRRSNYLDEVVRRTARLAANSYGTMVVAGGDGTINAALPHLLESKIPLGILPCGTANYAARELGIPLDLREAVECLTHGDIVDVPVGQVNDRYFLVNARLGLHSRLLEDREQTKPKSHRHRGLALLSAVKSAVNPRGHSFSLDVRGEPQGEPVKEIHRLDISTLVVGNNSLQLRRMGVEPEEPGNKLTAVALPVPGGRALLDMGARGTWEAKGAVTFAFERLIATEGRTHPKGVKVALDGEVTRLWGPLTFEHSSKLLKVVVPAPVSQKRPTSHGPPAAGLTG